MSSKKHIYILHGWAYSVEKWRPFLELLSKNFEYTFLKVPGLTAPLSETWNLDDYVNWLSDKLPSNRRVILLGHSNGGRISLAFAHKYSHRVESLILIDSAGLVDRRLKKKFKKFIFKVIAKIGKFLFPFPVLRKYLYKFTGEADYYNTPPTLRQTMQNLISLDLRSKLKDIATNTLIVWGEADKITPLSDGKTLNNQLKNSKLIIINNAKHAPMFTHPNKVFEAIKEFLI